MLASSFSSDLVKLLVTDLPSCFADAIAASTFAWLGVDSQTVGPGRHLATTVGKLLWGNHKHSSSHRTLCRNLYEVSPVNCDSLLTLTEEQTLCRTRGRRRLMIVSSSCLQNHTHLLD